MSETVYYVSLLGLIGINSMFIPRLQQGWVNLIAIGFISGMAAASFIWMK